MPASSPSHVGTTPPVVVITGGSSGIGLATALLFARRGWRVGLIARGGAGLEAAVARLGAGPGNAYAIADVADQAALEQAASQLEERLGPISVWVNNAGVSAYGRFSEITEAEFRRVLDVTLLGTVHGTWAALKRMMPRRQGVIVNVVSVIGFRGVPLQTPYSTAKYGVRGFTEALRSELIHDRAGVHLAMVHPPATNTPFFSHAASHLKGSPSPPPPVYRPELVAEAIWRAASQRRRDVMVTAFNVQTALLNSVLPGVMDRVAAWGGFMSQHTASRDVAQRRDPALFDAASRVSPVHGPFGQQAMSGSVSTYVKRHPWKVGFGLLALALAWPHRSSRAGR